MRRLLTFPCRGETLAGTLDGAEGRTGLLIVSGGNELRIGAHRGMALAAQAIATAGYPVFRFDRRGVGDSTGGNGGFESSAPDIAAAADTCRTIAGIERIVAFGNCDAATALAMHHRAAGIDALVLANPWIIEPADDLPPPAAIRARYASRLASWDAWRRLLTGRVDLSRAVRGLDKLLGTPPSQSLPLLAPFVAGLKDAPPTRILLAERDNTALAFADHWRHEALARRIPTLRCRTNSHSFARTADAAWLRGQLLAALAAA
ncbi:hydrolase 1, exosortase A system-associated [Sphingomonas sp. VNH70]|uniref:hydrolase 1, exosortase A system-associated n=1 Tax=Sphingomonas silueang TaxID=3156617 RepID=UPI0032B5516A